MTQPTRLPTSLPSAVNMMTMVAALNAPDPATFYGGDATGYTDYPRLAAA